MTEEKEDNGSSLMKLVEAIAITPKDARELVSQYEGQVRKAEPDASGERIQVLVTDKIIERYSKMAAATGGATSLAGVIPGIGPAVAMGGGGVADVSLCMKLAEPTKRFAIPSVCSLKSAPKLYLLQATRCQMMIRLCTLSNC